MGEGVHDCRLAGCPLPSDPWCWESWHPGSLVASSFVWWLWIQSVCKEGVWHVVGAGSSSHALPVHAQTFVHIRWRHGWLGLEDGANGMPPCAAAPLQHAQAAALPWQKVPGPCLPWTGSRPLLVRTGLGVEISKRLSAPALTLGLLLCPHCAHLETFRFTADSRM